MKKYAPAIKIAFLTASAIILFQIISLLAVYQYVRIDLYLSLVALCFLTAGLLIARRPGTTIIQEKAAIPRATLPPQLTIREFQILRLIAEGKTNKEIATTQYVEISTVKTHVNNIYSKLSVSNRMQARSKYAELAGRETL